MDVKYREVLNSLVGKTIVGYATDCGPHQEWDASSLILLDDGTSIYWEEYYPDVQNKADTARLYKQLMEDEEVQTLPPTRMLDGYAVPGTKAKVTATRKK